MEVELKLLVEAQYKQALMQHPLLTGDSKGPPSEHTLMDTYFDTPELDLRHQHAGLRVRRVNGSWVQNMKRNGSALGGMHARQEWESPVKGPQPQLALLRHLVDDKQTRRDVLGTPALKKRLTPVFTTQLTRTVWDVHSQEGDAIECALDQGTLACGGKDEAISELELELKSGNPTHLYDIALALQQDIPLQLGSQSKADRGYAMLAPGEAGAVKAQAVELSKDMNVEQAFQAIMGNCLGHMQANEAAVAHGNDVESLHQMRVGMRRMRSALKMCEYAFRLPEDLQQDLDWLGQALGDARDWDVLATSTLPALTADVPDPALLGDLQQAVQEQVRLHHVQASEAVNSARYTRLMLRLARWIQGMDWHAEPVSSSQTPASMTPDEAIIRFARRTIASNARRLNRRARKLRKATPQARHRFRIAAKKARYAVEFFDSLFPSKQTQPYLEGLERLQDVYGYLNDVIIAERLLVQLHTEQPQLAASMAYARGFLAAHSGNKESKALKLWTQFAHLPAPH